MVRDEDLTTDCPLEGRHLTTSKCLKVAICCRTTFQEAVIAQGLFAPSLRMMFARVGVALLP